MTRTYTFACGPLAFDVDANSEAEAVQIAQDAFGNSEDVAVLAPGGIGWARINLRADEISGDDIADIYPPEDDL